MRSVDFVAFVQFALDVWQTNHYSQVPPNIGCPKLQGIPNLCRSSDLCSESFTALYLQYSFSFQAIEILRETSAIGLQVVSLNDEHEKGVDFIERVQDGK